MAPKRCTEPLPTRRVVNPGTGPLARCTGCKTWMPARQVPWGAELRNSAGDITATYAPIPHGGQS